MPIVSKASDIKMERRKLYSILQNMDMLKSPLRYTKSTIHQRLWFIYFVRNLKPLIQIVGSLFALLCLFMFISEGDRKSTRLNSSHVAISYAVFCLKKKTNETK